MSRVIENPKQLILGKAKEILYNQGYHKLSMRALSKACDIALGTIYNYYPTKKDLVIEMMTDYWHEYFYKLKSIENLDCSFYDKLDKIFSELSVFIKTFKEVWLKPELYDKPEYIESGMKREYVFIERLIVFIQNIITNEVNSGRIHIKLDSYELAKFITMNFITVIQMPIFKYSSFQNILKELIN